ncbi:MAG: hypothetical protein KDB27_14735, partial [Planctomycetales bacterium]|nr:hypothetical protein [Planctomycetales bacterium]
LRIQAAADEFREMFVTVHKLDKPFTSFPDYAASEKTIAAHPIHLDVAMATRSVPNPHRKMIPGTRTITVTTGTNLSYETRSIRVRAGEAIAFTLSNPDVVPHNWVLVKPNALEAIGMLADRAVSDPDVALRHYIPESTDVLAYTDVVPSGSEFTIYFRAPAEPGHYPYLCTFPGHWKVMNGVMTVDP